MSNNNLSAHPLSQLFESTTAIEGFPYRKVSESLKARSKAVIVDGINFPSINSASRNLKIPPATLTERLASPNFPNYNYVTIEGIP